MSKLNLARLMEVAKRSPFIVAITKTELICNKTRDGGRIKQKNEERYLIEEELK